MNERIKQLAEQSMGTRKHVPPVWQFFDDELQKFAELIVEECVLQCHHNDDIDRIEKHFGVEE
jgi:hypothetical protein